MIPAKEFEGELWIRAADIHLLTKDKNRTWVGLTNEKYTKMWHEHMADAHISEYGKAIEAKLKELNT